MILFSGCDQERKQFRKGPKENPRFHLPLRGKEKWSRRIKSYWKSMNNSGYGPKSKLTITKKNENPTFRLYMHDLGLEEYTLWAHANFQRDSARILCTSSTGNRWLTYILDCQEQGDTIYKGRNLKSYSHPWCAWWIINVCW